MDAIEGSQVLVLCGETGWYVESPAFYQQVSD